MSINKTLSIRELKETALNNIGHILDKLGIEWVQRSEEYINILCPIHRSDNLGSCSIRLDNGVYKCWSRSCEEKIGGNFLDLIRACLSSPINKFPTWADVEDFIKGENFQIIERKFNSPKKEDYSEIKLMDISKYPSVTIPSKYYIDRGFTPETLTHFGIGDTSQYPYNGRTLVPVKTKEGALMGFSGRSQNPKCPKCEFYHSKYEGCIAKDYEYANLFNKWFHSKGLQKTKTLYGIEFIKQTDKIAIVEGPSCVWKLYEYGIPAVAVLGKSFKAFQADLLRSIGVSKVFFLPDQDEAGQLFKKKFIQEYYNIFQIYVTTLPQKDISEMSDEEIKKFIVEKWNDI